YGSSATPMAGYKSSDRGGTWTQLAQITASNSATGLAYGAGKFLTVDLINTNKTYLSEDLMESWAEVSVPVGGGYISYVVFDPTTNKFFGASRQTEGSSVHFYVFSGTSWGSPISVPSDGVCANLWTANGK